MNKYLTKIAASLSDEKDSAKTFGKAWIAGHAGVLTGAAIGGAALGSSSGRKLLNRVRRGNLGQAAGRMTNTLKSSRIGQVAGKWFGHKTGPAAIGGVVGGVVGGDVGDYAAIRHGVIQAKKNEANDNK